MRPAWKERIFPLGIPLSWRQLTSDAKRFRAAVAGITVAVTMMLFQFGLYDALFKTAIRHQMALAGELFILNKEYVLIARSGQFPRQRLHQALGDPGVASVASVWISEAEWKNPVTKTANDVFVFACRPGERTFDFPCVREQPSVLSAGDEIFFDAHSSPECGPVAELLRERGSVPSEVNSLAVRVRGLFELGSTFAAENNLLMGETAFFRLHPNFPRDQISVGLVHLREGENADEAARRLGSSLPADVQVMTREEFFAKDRNYWARRTPIGFVISASMLVGLLVGGVIIYQILYADVSDHISEYATLRGIGFSDQFFRNLVLQQALILSCVGFVPGVLLAWGLFTATESATRLPVELSLTRALAVLALTSIMCVAGGAFAARKLKSANPADLF